MRALLHAAAVAEVLLGAVLLGVPGTGDVPAVLLVSGALTALLAVAVGRLLDRPVPVPRAPEDGDGGQRVREPELV